MDVTEKNKLLKQILWDYDLSPEDIDEVLSGKKKMAGHYTREMIFQKLIETYPWFTIIQIISPSEIQLLLTDQLIRKLRSQSLRKKYEFVQKRLQQIIPVTG